MIEYRVTKRYIDVDEDEGFYVEKLVGPDNKDITKMMDTDINFEDDDELVEFLSEVFDQDPEEIDLIEEDLIVEYSGADQNEKLDPDNAGIIKG